MALSQPKPIADQIGPSVPSKALYWVGDVFGNNAYNQTGGDLYTANQFGMSGLCMVNVNDRDSSGTWVASAIYPANSSNASEVVAPASNNFALHWYSANGTEATNNNASLNNTNVVRLQVWGL